MFSGDKQSRQSSGPKSFFSRNKKDKANNDAPSVPETPAHLGYSGFATSTTGSRHSHRSSISTVEQEEQWKGGLNMQAGTITSVPYDNMTAEKPPVRVEHVDRPSGGRDPLPHYVNKGGGDPYPYPAMGGRESNGRGPPQPPTHGINGRNSISRSYDSDGATLNGAPATSRSSSDHGSIHSTSSHERRPQAYLSASQASFPVHLSLIHISEPTRPY